MEVTILDSIPFQESHLRGWWDGNHGVAYCRERKTVIGIDMPTIRAVLGENSHDSTVVYNKNLLTNPKKSLPNRIAPDGFFPELEATTYSLFKDGLFSQQICTPFVCFNLSVNGELILLEQLAELFKALPRSNPDDASCFLNISLIHKSYGWSIYINEDTEVINGLTKEQTAPYVLDLAMVTYYRNANFKYAFHGAAFQWQDRNIYLPAPSGSGKSTLFAYFNAQGAIPFSDEVITLNEQLEPVQIPFPMTLKKGSWPLFTDFKFFEQPWKRVDGRTLKYYPLNWKTPLSHKKPLIVFPKYSIDEKESITHISACKAIQNIGESGYELKDNGNEDAIETLIKWLDSLTLIEIIYHNSENAQKMILEAL